MIKKRLKKVYAALLTGIMALSSLAYAPVVKANEENEFYSDEKIINEEILEEDENALYAIDTNQAAWDVLDIVNQERANQGLPALVMDASLVNTARIRAQEIVTKFDHERPDGSSCFTAYDDSVFWWAVGENIAAGQGSAASVMNAWMNSSGHRANILNSDYNCIGIACVYVPNSTYRYYWVQNFGYTDNPQILNRDGSISTFEATGIYIASNSETGITAGLSVNNPYNSTLQYRWLASNDGGQTWTTVQGWKTGDEWLTWTPSSQGEYMLCGQARKLDDKSNVVESTTTINFHKYIKGICQMPNPDGSGGYLIGIESYDNPNNSYRYEMLILDCTLYAQGKDAWIYTTGKCTTPENCLWTIWKPQYGYYWTLFRIFDKNGNMLDEACFGFVNAY